MQKILFVVILEEEPPKLDFSLKNLPGESKIDVIARNILNLFPRSNSQLSVTYYAIFTKNSPMVLQVNGLSVREKWYDEIEIAAFIRDALEMSKEGFKVNSINNKKELQWYTLDDFQHFFKVIIELQFNPIYLHELGEPIETLQIKGKNENLAFILGGRQDISPDHEHYIDKIKAKKINLGEKSYLASTCILKILYEFEKVGEEFH